MIGVEWWFYHMLIEVEMKASFIRSKPITNYKIGNQCSESWSLFLDICEHWGFWIVQWVSQETMLSSALEKFAYSLLILHNLKKLVSALFIRRVRSLQCVTNSFLIPFLELFNWFQFLFIFKFKDLFTFWKGYEGKLGQTRFTFWSDELVDRQGNRKSKKNY